jgi:O-antigen polysaccharide polymerase Wzy
LLSVSKKRRVALYWLLNFGFVVTVIVLAAVGGSPNPRLMHLILLFALCSTSIIDLDGLNGRYALLAIFFAAYFVSFGAADLAEVLKGESSQASSAAFTSAEAVILVGGIMLALGYRMTVARASTTPRRSPPRDWPISSIIVVGLAMWAVGSFTTYWWHVHIVTDTTIEAAEKGIASAGAIVVSANLLGQLMQPLGILLLAYAWRLQRGPFLLTLVVVIVCLQVVLGFIVDIKGLAMTGGILVIMTIVLVEGQIPKLWLAAAAAFVIFVFPIFQAYRTQVHGNLGMARSEVAANLGKALELSLAAKDRVNSGRDRAQTFFERASVRGSLELIVENTGNGVNFAHGETLTPLLATFLPKIVWGDKPSVATGQLMNREFHVSEIADTYISPSHLGELYWNFGWPGVVLGMAMIGGLFGFIAGRFNQADAKTVTGLLVTVLTIKQVIVGFEGAIAPQYVVLLRSLAAVGILHWLFARIPVRAQASPPGLEKTSRSLDRSQIPSAFPNLMR